LVEKLGDKAGPITKLTPTVTVEVVDLDIEANREDVLTAFRRAIPGADSDLLAAANRREVEVTGLWSTRSGQQVATLKVPRSVAGVVTCITVGWIKCRVRPRTPEPKNCFRCHGFGHTSWECRGPDLTDACRRCGKRGHKAADCAGVGQCVACKNAGLISKAHNPGSALCGARNIATTTTKETDERR